VIDDAGRKTVVVGDRRYPLLAQLIVREGRQEGHSFPLYASDRLVIGRDGRVCQLVIDDPMVSSEHCAITYREGKLQIYDLASTNGTFVNDKPVAKPRSLYDRDVVKVGNTSLLFVQAWAPER
jgi:pSer/pThr/pTyr-binding forkhead associated (FHA) protein